MFVRGGSVKNEIFFKNGLNENEMNYSGFINGFLVSKGPFKYELGYYKQP